MNRGNNFPRVGANVAFFFFFLYDFGIFTVLWIVDNFGIFAIYGENFLPFAFLFNRREDFASILHTYIAVRVYNE